jgi:hypothetical protein
MLFDDEEDNEMYDEFDMDNGDDDITWVLNEDN